MDHIVAPSLLAANFSDLKSEMSMVNHSEADWLHIDVMDGVFVPNISFAFPIIKSIRPLSDKIFDVHLMIVQPDRYIESFKEAGADVITVHVEACKHLHRTLQAIRETGAKAGVAINPHTPVESVFEVLEDVDLVCLMSVNPGFGGQKFIYRTLDKIARLRREVTSRNLNVHIEIDGGVGLSNAEKILQAGADVLVAGSSVFKAEDPEKAISALKAFNKNNIA